MLSNRVTFASAIGLAVLALFMFNGAEAGMILKAEPVQMLSKILLILGVGLIGTVKVKLAPAHPALEGITV